MDDIRYSELVFLRNVANLTWTSFSFRDSAVAETVRIRPDMVIDMVATLLEDLYLRLQNIGDQLLVARIRGEASDFGRPPEGVSRQIWET